jgi:hypothetical protein
MAPEQLVPERRERGARDAHTGTIRIGSVLFQIGEADDDSLRAFLAAVRRERGLAPGAELAVRAGDAALLAEHLGGSADEIVRNLQRLLSISESEAVELGRWMFRRTAVAGALAITLAAGVVATGTFAANPPAAGAGVSAPRVANANADLSQHLDPNWAEIGDAAVLRRDELPGGAHP